MKKIYVCNPLRGMFAFNIEQARKHCRFVISKGGIPFAPHIYFTQFLDDTNEKERAIGMKQGMEWLKQCDELWVFGRVLSEGMIEEIELAQKEKIKVRKLENER